MSDVEPVRQPAKRTDLSDVQHDAMERFCAAVHAMTGDVNDQEREEHYTAMKRALTALIIAVRGVGVVPGTLPVLPDMQEEPDLVHEVRGALRIPVTADYETTVRAAQRAGRVLKQYDQLRLDGYVQNLRARVQDSQDYLHCRAKAGGVERDRVRWTDHPADTQAFDEASVVCSTLLASHDAALAVIVAVTAAVRSWAGKQGHDACHYYPDIFKEIWELVTTAPLPWPTLALPSRGEFEAGCRRYTDALYKDQPNTLSADTA